MAAAGCSKPKGYVAACEPSPGGEGYEVTVVFVEVTDDILAAIRDLSDAAVGLPG